MAMMTKTGTKTRTGTRIKTKTKTRIKTRTRISEARTRINGISKARETKVRPEYRHSRPSRC